MTDENSPPSCGNNSIDYCYASETIDCLQQVIHRFSDQHNRISVGDAKAFWQLRAPEETTTNSSSPSSPRSSKNNHDSNNDDGVPRPTLKDIVHRYAPVGLEAQFEQLYCLLHPCLVVRDNDSNAAAFCLGSRGMGKNLLVDRCLQSFQDELRYAKSTTSTSTGNTRKGGGSSSAVDAGEGTNRNSTTMFRVVQVHGVLIPGHDVNLVVRDMLQQLSQTAFEEAIHGDDRNDINNDSADRKNDSCALSARNGNVEDEEAMKKRQKRQQVDRRGLRLRMSTFDSNLQLLGETLKIARVDQIPILIVLDEVDAFLGGSSAVGSSVGGGNSGSHSLLQTTTAGGRDRQLLLYHLLDRVATQGSNVCLIGLTQHLALRSKLEKRIKSRMEGTSKEIFVGPCPSTATLTSVLLSRVKSHCYNNHNDDNKPLSLLQKQISEILSPSGNTADDTNQNRNNRTHATQRQVWETLERECRMGRNIRWFSRILTVALSLYRGEWIQYRRRHCLKNRDQVEQQEESQENQTQGKDSPPKLEASHLLDALAAQGASIVPLPKGGQKGQQDNNKRRLNSSSNNNNTTLVVMSAGNAVDPRIQALVDLSAPQVALVLAARRILARDAQWNGETANPPPLTLGRMLQEYGKFARTSSQRYSQHLLWIAFQEMLEINLLRPASDHCGTGPFQYNHQLKVYSSIGEAEDVPLQLVVDVNRELMVALQNNMLEASTAMREWGRKTNT